MTKKKNKDNVVKRILRGFKVMYSKVANSNYVQNIKADQQTADPNEFATDFSQFSNSDKNSEDVFATKF